MQTQQDISTIFPAHLFWDVNMAALNFEVDKTLIIPRALYVTTAESFNDDIQKLERIYSKKVILQVLKNTQESISNEVCKLVAIRYNVPVFYRFAK